MKTRSKQGRRRFELRITYGSSYYIQRIAELEKILRRKPRTLHIEMVGVGEMSADSALLLRSVLVARSPKTRIVTNARSSLQGGSVMIWLLGDKRTIRDDAWVYFRRADLPEDAEADPNADWKQNEPRYRDSFSYFDPEEGDYARLLQVINEYLPVKELAGRLIGGSVLRQFGLVENEQVDGFLATAFGKSSEALVAK
jgi:hypothetical protein